MPTPKKTEQAAASTNVTPRIVKRVPRPAKFIGPVIPAGIYRVIHGVVTLPRPLSEWMRPDGTEIPHEPKFIEAGVVFQYDAHGGLVVDEDGFAVGAQGDEIELGSDDATRLMAAGVIERLDASPSRVGRVFTANMNHVTKPSPRMPVPTASSKRRAA